MQILVLKSENKKALNAIKTLAKILDIESSMKKKDEEKKVGTRKKAMF